MGGGFSTSCTGCKYDLTNVAFHNNRAASLYGGGLNLTYAAMTMTNATFAGNQAGSKGGGLAVTNYGYVTMTNSIVWGNSADQNPEIYVYKLDSSVLIAFSDIKGSGGSGSWDGTVGTDGGDNIDSDPFFWRPPSAGPDGIWANADDDYGDLRLWHLSPAIDAGNNAALPVDTYDLDGDYDFDEPLPFDIQNGPRRIDHPHTDSGAGTPPLVDMGAFDTWLTLFLPLI